ncbi:MAG: sterol desaturase family protein [Deltaproteobacteria bacterium]|nr:sterol desaturase family protein [Deltaproteobacteria bacterium]
MRAFFVVVSAYALVALVFTAIEWRSGKRWWRRDDVGTDVAWTLLTFLGAHQAGRAGAVVVAVVVAVFLLGAPGGDAVALKDWLMNRETVVGSLPLWAQIPLGLLVHDVAHYAMHRCFHASSRLWSFHAIHHSAAELDWFATLRGHPVNDLLQRVAAVVPLLVLGFKPGLVAGVAPVVALYGLLLHANVSWDFGPLRGVLASPHFHRWHHADVDGTRHQNFAGLFPFIDRAFGTFHMPANAPEKCGVADEVPRSALAQLWWPLVRTRFNR